MTSFDIMTGIEGRAGLFGVVTGTIISLDVTDFVINVSVSTKNALYAGGIAGQLSGDKA